MYYGFGVDTNDELLKKIPRACAKRNMSKPPSDETEISWSLDKVLRYALQIDNLEASFDDLLRKTLFLLAMASGARVSEIAALTRDARHVHFNEAGEAILRPNKAFLAKNERGDKRWKPWKIVPCPDEPALCPVQALRDYMDSTSSFTSDPLFRREGGGRLLIKGVRDKILYFIKKGDPEGIPKAHDVRKVSSSLNYFQYMDFEDLCEYTGWKSLKVFFKHYAKSQEEVTLPVVAAGKVIFPNS